MLIIANGFPRSGSTKLYNVLQAILLRDPEFVDLGYCTEADVAEGRHDVEALLRSGKIVLLKSHSTTERTVSCFRSITRVYHFYTHRDLREAILSARRVWSLDGDEIRKLLQENLPTLGESLSDPNCFDICYRRLVEEPESVFQEITRAMDIDLPEERLEEILNRQHNIATQAGAKQGKWLAWLPSALQAIQRRFSVAPIARQLLSARQFAYVRSVYLGFDPKTALHPGHYAMEPYAPEEIEEAERILSEVAPNWRFVRN